MGRLVGRVGEGLILVGVVGGVGKGEEGTSFVEPLIGIGLEFCFGSAGKVQAEMVVGMVQVETMRVGVVLAVMASAGMFGLLGNSLFAHPPPAETLVAVSIYPHWVLSTQVLSTVSAVILVVMNPASKTLPFLLAVSPQPFPNL
jgi:hypothetical protein